MALDFRATREIKTPEMYQEAFQQDPARDAYYRAQAEDTHALAQERLITARTTADEARAKQMKAARISQALANAATPYEAAKQLEQIDPEAAWDLKGKLSDHALKMIQGVTSYQAIPSAWQDIKRYVGDEIPMPTFTSQDEFNVWKREQVLAHATAATYLEQTKPAAAKTEPNPNEYSIALQAAAGDEKAIKALEIIKGQHPGSAAGAGSDYQQFLARYATSRGKTVEKLTDVEELDARTKFMRADDPLKTGAAGPKPRGVTAGAAYRIADINTSIGEAKAVRETLSGVPGATGNRAGFEAWLPKAITNATGIGVEAKQRNAVIARVKQIIGKGLEGGVLRREDEYKYKDILPTIDDDPAVVTSKLDGLDAALLRKREVELSSLEDAGYDVSRYRAREAAAPKDNATAFSVKAPNGTTYTFKSKADLDAFKTRAGIK